MIDIARPINNPLALIAVLAATTEASALASLPLLDYRNQGVFVWFLVAFPPFLTLLFFITLNFNRQALAIHTEPAATGVELAIATGDPQLAPAARGSSSTLASLAPTTTGQGNPPAAFPARTQAFLHILEYSSEQDRQQLRPLVHAWADHALAEPHDKEVAVLLLLNPTQ